MVLLDWFRRSPAEAPRMPEDVYTRLGALEGEVERLRRLELSWADYRDQLNRLANRIEKRAQRADGRAAAAAAADPEEELPWEVRAARINRAKNGGAA